jgi:type IX secretion system PorP/SprF family membrane protein
MKTKLIVCLWIFTVSVAAAQQYSPRTHFYQNSLAYNPAISGTEEEVPIRLNFRQQWTGLDDAPNSQTLSSHGYVGKNVGLGVVLYNDVAGPSRNTGLQASMARHFALDKEGKRWFSFGLALVMYQYKFDLDRLKTDTPNDPAVLALASQNSRLTPDLVAGFYINDENGFVGISCMNMIQNKSDMLDQSNNFNTVARSYYLFAGYKFPVNKELSIEPATLFKVTEAKVWQADVMVKVNYNNYWGGISYRTSDALSLLLGMRVDLFGIGYSYDYPVSGIGNYNKGTHEITATVYIFNSISRSGPLEKIEPLNKRRSFNKPHRRRN